jgi:hypothetical protein
VEGGLRPLYVKACIFIHATPQPFWRWGGAGGTGRALARHLFFFFFFSVRLISLFASLQPTFSLLVLFRGEGGASLLGGVMGRYGGLGGVCTTESLE